MPEVTFAKLHGLGNDFVMVDGVKDPGAAIDPGIAARLADRRTGIGADQVLLLGRGEDGEFTYRIWNQDGGEVAQCGNGARSAHYFLRDRGYCGERTRLRTSAGLIEVRDGKLGPRAFLGVPRFEPGDVPLAREARQEEYGLEWRGRRLTFASLSIGNPHAVFWVDDDATAPVQELGEELNGGGDFPQGVNASFAVRTSDDSIRMRVYERGVGETPACGSAVAACAVVAYGPSSSEFKVTVRGGELLAGWDGEGSQAWVEGAVAHVFDGTVDLG